MIGNPGRSGKGGRLAALVAVALVAAGGCGDDAAPFEPGVDPEVVAGIYDISVLTFDPLGSLQGADIAARLDPAIRPQLVIALDATFQLAFIDPATKRIETVDGEYATLADGVRLEFGAAADAQRLLLPQRLDLLLDEGAGSLSFAGEVDVALARLVQLVPEYADEQLRDPVRGDLEVVFTPREDPGSP